MKRITLNALLSLTATLVVACAADSSSEHANDLAPRSAAVSTVRATDLDALGSTVRDDAAVVAQLIELGRRDSRAEAHLRHLCLTIGPRLTSSHNLATAEQWALAQFRDWGLDAHLDRWGEYPVGFDRGPFRGHRIGAESEPFEFTTMSWTAGTQGPTRGAVLFKPETLAQLAEVKDRIAGAWLISRSYPRGSERPKVEKEERDELTAALALAGSAGEIRSAGRNLVITDGNHKIAWDELPKTVRVVLRADQFKALADSVEAGESVEVEFDIDNRFYEGPVQQYNVVADIRGSEFPDEYVIVSGHLDSWDGAQGAVDNATGCATTMEAARLLMACGAKPRRTIRFILWSGEEQGLFGSTGYVRDHKDQLERISAVYVHDGGTNYLSGLGITIDMEKQMREVCAPLFDLNPAMPFKLRVNDGFRYSPDSDHAPFAGAGVPGFFWDQSGKSDYTHMHHTQYDTFETAVNEYQEHSSLVAAIVAFNTANLQSRMNRDFFEALPPRRMGVNLDGTKLGSVTRKGMAAEAGWQVDDVVVSIDGVAISTREEISEELQKGGPRKVVVIRRGETTIETVLDFSAGKDEEQRILRAKMRAERQLAEQKKFW